MPLVNVYLIEGVFTPEQNCEMIHQLTEAMVRIEDDGQPRPLPPDLSYHVPRCRRRAAS
jgi:hypothetical protein